MRLRLEQIIENDGPRIIRVVELEVTGDEATQPSTTVADLTDYLLKVLSDKDAWVNADAAPAKAE